MSSPSVAASSLSPYTMSPGEKVFAVFSCIPVIASIFATFEYLKLINDNNTLETQLHGLGGRIIDLRDPRKDAPENDIVCEEIKKEAVECVEKQMEKNHAMRRNRFTSGIRSILTIAAIGALILLKVGILGAPAATVFMIGLGMMAVMEFRQYKSCASTDLKYQKDRNSWQTLTLK